MSDSDQTLNVNILGMGTMGSQIGGLLALLGHRVTAWNHGNLEERQKKCQKTRRLLARKFEDRGGRSVIPTTCRNSLLA